MLTGLPAGFVDETVLGGLPYPTEIAFSRDERMFVALKSGVVRCPRAARCCRRRSSTSARGCTTTTTAGCSAWTDRSRTFVVSTTPATYTAVYENRLPTARITGGTGGAAPLTVTPDGRASTGPEGDTLQYAWTDGQGDLSTSPTPSLSYPTPGTYRVGLTVTDQLGGTGTASYDVVVTGDVTLVARVDSRRTPTCTEMTAIPWWDKTFL